MEYHSNWLIEKLEKGEKMKYLLFWGHQPKKDGMIGETCLSQWWMAPFKVDGVEYRSTEHWMMAEKARLFNDEEIREKIIAATLREFWANAHWL